MRDLTNRANQPRLGYINLNILIKTILSFDWTKKIPKVAILHESSTNAIVPI